MQVGLIKGNGGSWEFDGILKSRFGKHLDSMKKHQTTPFWLLENIQFIPFPSWIWTLPGIHGVHVHQQFSVLWAVAGTSCLKRLFSMLKAGCHGFTCNWQNGCAILAVFVNVYDHPQSTRQLEREGRLSCRCKFQCRTPTGLALQEPC